MRNFRDAAALMVKVTLVPLASIFIIWAICTVCGFELHDFHDFAAQIVKITLVPLMIVATLCVTHKMFQTDSTDASPKDDKSETHLEDSGCSDIDAPGLH